MSKKMISTAITAVLALGINSSQACDNHHQSAAKEKVANKTSTMQMANLKDSEKCYGIAKAHQNDCGTTKHGCAGEAKVDGDKAEWVTVPSGLCNKIIGSNLKEPQTT